MHEYNNLEAEHPPLKIKIFLWYLQRWVTLLKDSLTKRNWHGSQKYCFYDCNETIKPLFFDCQHAKAIWCIIRIPIGLTPPRSISHVFGNWLTSFGNGERKLIFVVVAAFFWAIRCTRNDVVF
jgi:hypothetical protein